MKQQLDNLLPETLINCHGLRYEATRLHQKMEGVISVFDNGGEKEVVLCSNNPYCKGYDRHLASGYKHGIYVGAGKRAELAANAIDDFKLTEPIPKSSLESQVSMLKAAFEKGETHTVKSLFDKGYGSPTKVISRLTHNGAYPLKRTKIEVPNRFGSTSIITQYQKASV